MRGKHLLFVALAIAGACKKDKTRQPPSPSAPASTADQDALWALAPDEAIVGIVGTPAALARFEGGAAAIEKVFATVPELAPFKAKMEQEIEDVLGGKTLSLAAMGLTSKKGFAFFLVGGETPIVIVPVGDRDKFLAVTKGTKGADGVDTIKRATCKTVKNVYACSRSPELFDRLGKGNLGETLKLVGARGDLEGAAIKAPLENMSMAAVAQLGSGSVTVRAAVKGLPAEAKKFFGNVKPRVDGDKTAGFAVVNFTPMVSTFVDKVPARPIAEGVMLDALVKAFAGPVTMTIENATMTFDVRVPLNDEEPVKKLVEQCDKLPISARLGATVKDGVCHVVVPQMQFELDGWVADKTLRIGKKAATSTTQTSPPSPVAQELARGEWTFAMFGRGTLFAPLAFSPPTADLDPDAMLGLRAMAILNEMGIGVKLDGDVVRGIATVRTIWSNPDDVVAKLVALDPKTVMSGKASAEVKAIVDAAPSSPFAADYKTGMSGLMMPVAMLGMMAAVAVPAYMDYMKKGKSGEAALHLNKLGKNLKLVYIEESAFPKGKAGPSPSKTCCGEPANRCQPDPAAWADPIWTKLDFAMFEPHQYRYAYESTDGKTFVAKAIGDLDCNGEDAEWTMTGSVDAQGNPTVEIAKPPAGKY